MAEETIRKSGLNAAWIARAKPKEKPYKLSDHAKLERIADTMAAASSFKAVADEWLEKARLEQRAAATIKNRNGRRGWRCPRCRRSASPAFAGLQLAYLYSF